jgi:cell wall-associated NlpC family hydrolase
LAPGQLITPGPPTATDVAGYATDGDGDGIADPWDPADAVASTARLLAVNGAGAGNLSGAVWAYNHDPTYVEEVLALSTAYQSATPVTAGTPAAGSGPGQTSGSVAGPGTSLGVGAPAAVAAVLGVARAQLGTPYQWGGAGPAGFDCSGLVMVAFAAAGVGLPHNAAAQYEVTAGRPAPLNGLRPGDLVFFGTSVPTIEHVGIYVGGGQMIDAPHTGAVVRIEPIGWSDLLVATRPLS